MMNKRHQTTGTTKIVCNCPESKSFTYLFDVQYFKPRIAPFVSCRPRLGISKAGWELMPPQAVGNVNNETRTDRSCGACVCMWVYNLDTSRLVGPYFPWKTCLSGSPFDAFKPSRRHARSQIRGPSSSIQWMWRRPVQNLFMYRGNCCATPIQSSVRHSACAVSWESCSILDRQCSACHKSCSARRKPCPLRHRLGFPWHRPGLRAGDCLCGHRKH